MRGIRRTLKPETPAFRASAASRELSPASHPRSFQFRSRFATPSGRELDLEVQSKAVSLVSRRKPPCLLKSKGHSKRSRNGGDLLPIAEEGLRNRRSREVKSIQG